MARKATGPLTPEQALQLAKTLADLYATAAADLLTIIGRATTRGIDSPRWAEQALGNTLQLRANAQRILDRLQTNASAETIRMLEEAYAGGLAPTTGLTGVNHASVLALARDTQRLTDGLRPGVLRWVDDVYRQTIAETVGSAVTGSVSRREAAAKALDRFAAQGVGGFTDAAGRRWQLDTYADMATRTAVGRAHLAGTLDRFEADGRTHVIVSDSPEECPQCRPYEGRVLSLGADEPPPDQVGAGLYTGTLNAAIGRGLLHPNCTHRLGAWVPGLSRPFDRPTENPQGYEDRQRQRALERRVRESKRRVAAATAVGDPTVLQQQKQLLTRRRQALDAFNTAADRKHWTSAQRTRIPPGPLVPDQPAYDPLRRALGITRQVHSVPPRLPTVSVRRVDLPNADVGATYRFAGPGPHTPTSRYPVSTGLDVNTRARDLDLSAVHEYGHLLDHRGLGTDPERFASAVDRTGDLREVMDAIDRSEARVELTRLRQTVTDPDLTAHLAYLVDPRELFARAYAQWIAVQTGDRRLLAQLRRRQGANLPYQWDDDDFAAVGESMTRLFRRAGLLREDR